MAASDAKPVPKKNVAYQITFPILDADGDLVTGATGLDSEISKDNGTFTDCASEATELATNSGMYYLDLTAAEMNADVVAIIVKTTSVGAKTTPMVLYPEETGDIRVQVTGMDDGVITAAKIAADAITAAKIASDALTAAKFAADCITAAKLAADVTTELQAGLSTASALAAVQTDVDNLQTRVPLVLVGGKMDSHVDGITVPVTEGAVILDATRISQLGLRQVTATADSPAGLFAENDILLAEKKFRIFIPTGNTDEYMPYDFDPGLFDEFFVDV